MSRICEDDVRRSEMPNYRCEDMSDAECTQSTIEKSIQRRTRGVAKISKEM